MHSTATTRVTSTEGIDVWKRILALSLASAMVLVACETSSQQSSATVLVEGSSVHFESVEDMARASQVIVAGTVIDVGEGEFRPAPETEDFKGTQDLEITVQIDQVLKGDVLTGDTVAIRWFGYDVALDETKGPQWVVEGLLPPEVGDRNLWFLIDETSGKITYGRAVAAFEGRVEITSDDGLKPPDSIDSGAAAQLRKMSLTQVAELLSSTQG